MKHLLYIILVLLNTTALTSYVQASDKLECIEQKEILGGSLGKVDCLTPYHHYHSDSSKYYSYSEAMSKKKVRIATFNVFQAGSTKTEFKDIPLMARVINNWDVVGAVELVSNVGVKKRHNDLIVAAIEAINDNPTLSYSQRVKKVKLLKEQYEQPGYVEILLELRKLDPSWSLLVTPYGDGVDGATVKELSGYFYRARYVKPIKNDYCSNYVSKSSSFACYVQFEENFYGKNVSSLLSRLPFMASFRSGRFDFSPIVTHTIYTPPKSKELRKRILKAAYGVSSLSSLNADGIRVDTYARFAEIKHILQFSKLYTQSFKENDVIVMGDFNLNADNPYWAKLLSKYSGVKIKVEEKTSLALSQFQDDEPTNGLTNNYDHFLVNEDKTSQCDDKAAAFNFIENSIGTYIRKKYQVRSSRRYTRTIDGDEIKRFYISKDGREKLNQLKKDYRKKLASKYTVVNGQIERRYPSTGEKVEDLERKLLEPQTYERTYYRFYQEVLSDHLPVYMNCRNTYDDD